LLVLSTRFHWARKLLGSYVVPRQTPLNFIKSTNDNTGGNYFLDKSNGS